MSKSYLDEVRARAETATPGPWTFTGNVPFYVDVKKPAPSLSKHDNDRPTYWRYEDGVFLAHARYDVPELLRRISLLIEACESLIAGQEFEGVPCVPGSVAIRKAVKEAKK